jgi:hypothetical protein
MADIRKTQRSVTQKQVLRWLKGHFPGATVTPQKKRGKYDNRGPDGKLCRHRRTYCFEAIAFSHKTKSGRSKKWKNQADFWKAFSQAISRLNPESEWGVPDVSVILLPLQFSAGWRDRVDQLGKDVWMRIGRAFPKLEIWFLSKKECHEFSWSKAFNAFSKKKGE